MFFKSRNSPPHHTKNQLNLIHIHLVNYMHTKVHFVNLQFYDLKKIFGQKFIDGIKRYNSCTKLCIPIHISVCFTLILRAFTAMQ